MSSTLIKTAGLGALTALMLWLPMCSSDKDDKVSSPLLVAPASETGGTAGTGGVANTGGTTPILPNATGGTTPVTPPPPGPGPGY